MQIGVQFKIKNRMANCVDPDETAHYKSLIWICSFCTGIGLDHQAERVEVSVTAAADSIFNF